MYKAKPEDRVGAVQIKCCDYQATYITDTSRNIRKRLTEYKPADKTGNVKPLTANRSLQ